MKALDTILQTGKPTSNEIYLAKKLDELTEEMEKLKPHRFKVVKPFRLKESG
jgi:hypothetical protein